MYSSSVMAVLSRLRSGWGSSILVSASGTQVNPQLERGGCAFAPQKRMRLIHFGSRVRHSDEPQPERRENLSKMDEPYSYEARNHYYTIQLNVHRSDESAD